MAGIAVLMYHALEDEHQPLNHLTAGERVYVLRAGQFQEQMELLHREGFRTFFTDEILEMEQCPEKGVVLTFDDGHSSNCTLALPILQQYGFKAEFFITTDWIGTKGYLSGHQIRLLQSAGMRIGSHGESHGFLDDMARPEIERELRQSMQVLSAITATDIVSFSAPGGRLKPLAREIAASLGYRTVHTSHPGVLGPSQNAYAIPRFDVRRQTGMDDFRKLVHLDRDHLRCLQGRHRRLNWLKRALGNRLYDVSRQTFIKLVGK